MGDSWDPFLDFLELANDPAVAPSRFFDVEISVRTFAIEDFFFSMGNLCYGNNFYLADLYNTGVWTLMEHDFDMIFNPDQSLSRNVSVFAQRCWASPDVSDDLRNPLLTKVFALPENLAMIQRYVALAAVAARNDTLRTTRLAAWIERMAQTLQPLLLRDIFSRMHVENMNMTALQDEFSSLAEELDARIDDICTNQLPDACAEARRELCAQSCVSNVTGRLVGRVSDDSATGSGSGSDGDNGTLQLVAAQGDDGHAYFVPAAVVCAPCMRLACGVKLASAAVGACPGEAASGESADALSSGAVAAIAASLSGAAVVAGAAGALVLWRRGRRAARHGDGGDSRSGGGGDTGALDSGAAGKPQRCEAGDVDVGGVGGAGSAGADAVSIPCGREMVPQSPPEEQQRGGSVPAGADDGVAATAGAAATADKV
jgi:hypothetical protein